MKYLIVIFLIFYTISSSAQWSDNFTDGNFSANPSWTGDVDKYIVNTTQQLQLKAPATDGSAYLSTASAIATKATWTFLVKMDFNPSSSNYAKVFLMSNTADLTSPLNGYFLRIGGTNDDLCLFRKESASETLIIDGRDKVFNTAAVNARIKVTRDNLGNWELYCDSTGGSNFRLSGKGADNKIVTSSFFGVQCIYTSTRSTKFYFDDFVVTADGTTDGTKPFIENFKILDNKDVQIVFSEPVDFASATKSGNYLLENNAVSTIALSSGSNQSIDLAFSNPFLCGQDNLLQIKGVADISGLPMNDSTLKFRYCTPQMHDVVFNEIMADPTPVNGLPEAEYLELYNRSSKTFNISGWKLMVGTASFTFPELTMPADSYLLVTTKDDEPKFEVFGPVTGLFTSSTTLNNTGQYLKLEDSDENLVSWVDYDDTWYGDDFKAQGGWSLEQIDPWNPCAGKTNWKASCAKAGGTPGNKNSVYGQNPDATIPDLLHVHVPADTVVYLYFSEPLDSTNATNPATYKIQPEIGQPKQVMVLDDNFESVKLLLPKALKQNVTYSITISKEISDCSGNKLSQDLVVPLGVPLMPGQNDIVINEVLFNAKSGGTDYVELYNRSAKMLNARQLLIGTKTDGKVSNICRLSVTGFLVYPASYLLISSDKEKVKPFYKIGDEKCFIDLPSMPSLDDKTSTVVILNDTLGVIDEFTYSDKMHSPVLRNTEGISLERVNPDKATYSPGNWHSAAESAGFGTPGYQNSQYLTDTVSSGGISIANELFSPDNDGYNDLLQISYKFDKPGCRALANVFDVSGRLVRRLLNNESLDMEGSFTWDGTNDAGRLCNIGMYVVFIRTVFDDGTVHDYKKSCVLAIKR